MKVLCNNIKKARKNDTKKIAAIFCEERSYSILHVGQIIQEWTEWSLFKTALKKFEVIWFA